MKSLNLAKPHLVVVVGIPGSGKTFFANQFSRTFNIPYLRTDDLLTFSDDEQVLNRLWDFMLHKLFQTRQSILIEGMGATAIERRQLTELARDHGYQALFVWVQTEPAAAKQRALRGDAAISAKEFERQTARFQSIQSPDHYMVISGKHTYASQAKNVLKKLVESRVQNTKLSPEKRPEQHPEAPQMRGRITIN